jgi:hypothetical protein
MQRAIHFSFQGENAMRLFRCFLAALLAAGIVTVVAAQPGFGGGGGSPDVESLVFTNTALQDEIKVTAEQKEAIKPVAEKMEGLAKKRAEMFTGGKGKFDKDKFAELKEEGDKVTAERKKVYEKFTDAQKKRLKQIQAQAMYFAVFNDPEAKGGKGGFGRGPTDLQKEVMKDTQAALKLSDSQKSSIKGISSDFTKESGAIMKDSGAFTKGGFDQEKLDEATKKVEKVRKEEWSKVMDLLDDSQKKAWKEMTGEAFDTSKLRTPAPKRD